MKEESKGKRKRKRKREWLNKSEPIRSGPAVDHAMLKSVKGAANLGKMVASAGFSQHIGLDVLGRGAQKRKLEQKGKRTEPKPKSTLQAFFDTLQG